MGNSPWGALSHLRWPDYAPGVRNEDSADLRQNSPRAQCSKDVIAAPGDSSFFTKHIRISSPCGRVLIQTYLLKQARAEFHRLARSGGLPGEGTAASSYQRIPRSDQKLTLIPACPIRAGCALVTKPKGPFISPLGVLNCAWLNRLKYSMRKSNPTRSVMWVVFIRETSVLFRPGPCRNRRLTFPAVPIAGSEKGVVSKYCPLWSLGLKVLT